MAGSGVPGASDDLGRLAEAPFVSLTTFRRDGRPVSTPMWSVRDGDALVFWTPRGSWKVRRVRRDPRVRMARCSRLGRVAPDEPIASGTATVVEEAEAVARGRSLMREEYGVQLPVLTWLQGLFARGARRRVLLRVVLEPGG